MSRLRCKLIALLLAGPPAWAQPPAASPAPLDVALLRLRSLAATCAACHGTDGRAIPAADVPGLAGRPAAELESLLKAFRDGTRPGTVMPQLAKGYDEAQITAMARHFAALPARRPSPSEEAASTSASGARP